MMNTNIVSDKTQHDLVYHFKNNSSTIIIGYIPIVIHRTGVDVNFTIGCCSDTLNLDLDTPTFSSTIYIQLKDKNND